MFCWCQIGTTDPDAAKKFYAPLFGWNYEDAPVAGQPFSLIKKSGKTVGGLYALIKEQRDRGIGPMWEPYIAVDDVDQTVKRVKGARGKVLMDATDIADHGRMAMFEDPTTAVVSVWQAKKQIGSEIVNEPGSMCWNELITNDSAKAGPFYRNVFDWTEETRPSLAVGVPYTVFSKNGQQAAGMMQATPEMHLTHPYWLVYFAVDDCDTIAAKAEQLRGKVVMKPTDIPQIGRFAGLTDPQGTYFAIIALTMANQGSGARR